MASMSVSMSDKMRTFVRERVESGDYYNESEYIRDLIRRDAHSRAVQRDAALQADEDALFRHLEEAEASGVSERNVLDIMRDAKAELKRDGEVRSLRDRER